MSRNISILPIYNFSIRNVLLLVIYFVFCICLFSPISAHASIADIASLTGVYNPPIMGHVGETLHIQGNYLYAFSSFPVVSSVFDISDPTDPVAVSNERDILIVPHAVTPNTSVSTSTYLYFASHPGSQGGIGILDYSDPLAPQASEITGSAISVDISYIEEMTIVGDTLFALNAKSGVSIFDISNPTSPTYITTYQDPIFFSGHTVFGRYEMTSDDDHLYILNEISDNVVVVNISDVSSPYVEGELPITLSSGSLIDLRVEGTYLHFVKKYSATSYYVTIDVSDPANPVVADQSAGAPFVSSSPLPTAFDISNGYAYVLDDRDDNLIVFDVSDPTNVSAVAEEKDSFTYPIPPLGRPASIVVKGNYAYVSANYVLLVYDISNPSDPVFVAKDYGIFNPSSTYVTSEYIETGGTQNYFFDATDVTVEGDRAYAFTANAALGLGIVDISDPASPVLLSDIGDHTTTNISYNTANGDAYALDVQGSYAYVGYLDDRNFQILDVSDPTNVNMVVYLEEPLSHINDIYVEGSYAYVTSLDGPEYPTDCVYDFTIFSYVCPDPVTEFAIIDISTTLNPVLVDSFTSLDDARLHSPFVLKKQGDYVYIINIDNNSLVVVDVSTPGSSSIVGEATNLFTTAGHTPHDIEVTGDYAHILSNWGRHVVVDISDPTNPVRLGEYSFTPYSPQWSSLELVGSTLLTNSNSSFVWKDISDPSSLVDGIDGTAASTLPLGGIENFVVAGDNIFGVGDGYGDVRTYEITQSVPSLTFDTVPPSPLTVTEGDPVTLGWTVTNMDICTTTNDWLPNGELMTATDGTYSSTTITSVTPTQTFGLTCSAPGSGDGNWAKVTQPAAGTIAAGEMAGIDGIYASANVGGTLYVGTHETSDKAEVYRYDGGTSWTKISQPTAGQIAAGGTTGINSVFSMADVNGTLYIGTNESDKAEVYRYDGGTSWTRVSYGTGQIAAGDTSGINTVYSMTEAGGNLYVGTWEANKAEVYRYDGGTSWTKISQPTAGQIAAGGTTGVDRIGSMVEFGGALYVGTYEINKAEVYRYDGGTSWTRVSYGTGQITASGTTNVGAVYAMTDVDGTLYIGVGSTEVYRYDGGTNWTKVTEPAAGQIVTGGTSVLIIGSMAEVNGTLFLGTYTPFAAEVYRYDGGTSWTRISQSSPGQIAQGDTTSITGIYTMTNLDDMLYIGTWNKAEVYVYDTNIYISNSVDVTVNPLASPTLTLDTVPPSPISVILDDTVTLEWSVTDMTSCSSTDGWLPDGTAKNAADGTYTEDVTATSRPGMVFTMNCMGLDSQPYSDSVTVFVDYPPPTLSLTADANPVYAGGTTTLEWTSTNMRSCDSAVDWPTASKGINGTYNEEVSPPYPLTRYQLDCEGLDESSISAFVDITVVDPTVTVSADVPIVRQGEVASITWDTGNLPYQDCTLSGYGVSPITATSGSQDITLDYTSKYVLDCGVASAETTVRVAAPPIEN